MTKTVFPLYALWWRKPRAKWELFRSNLVHTKAHDLLRAVRAETNRNVKFEVRRQL